MVKIEYTIKIKDKHNPPEFKEGMGKGVVSKVNAEYGVTEEELDKNPRYQIGIIEQMEELLKEYFEVVPKIIK